MIPHKLTLKNFLSYGDTMTTIDFGSYNLICLSGKNGNGKSALLDAITWAIWGQARKIGGVSKPDEGLLRLGATRMMVTLDFSFNGNLYRVRREYVRTNGKPIANLDIEMLQPGSGRFVSMTDKTIRATQEKIEKLIGLDYETFVNSSFIRQGQSNEFSKKSPKERKQILASILGLGHYDALQSKALEHARQLQTEKATSERVYALAAHELAQQETLQVTDQAHAQQEVVVRAQLKDLEQQNSRFDQTAHALKLKLVERERSIKEVQELQREHEVVRTEFRALHAAWKEAHHQLLQIQHGTHRQAYRAQLEAQSVLLTSKQQQMTELQKKIVAAERIYETQRAADDQRKAALSAEREKKRVLQAKIGSQLQYMTTQRTQFEARLKELSTFITQREAVCMQELKALEQTHTVVTQFEKRRSFYQTYVQRGQWLTRQTSDMSAKRTTLEAQESGHCPLCEQLVTAARKKFLHTKLTQQERFFVYQRNKLALVLKKLKELLVAQHEEVQSRKKREEHLAQQQIHLTEARKQRDALEAERIAHEPEYLRLVHDAELLAKELAELEVACAQTDATVEAAKALVEQLKKEVIALGYDAVLHAHITQELHAVLSAQATDSEEPLKARRALYKERVQTSITNMRKIVQRMQVIEKSVRELDAVSPQIQEIERQKNEIAVLCTQRRQELEQLVALRAQLAHEMARLHKIAAEQKTRESDIKKIDASIEMYQHVAAAFSKNGVPALLIEDVIPELETEANALLQKLTNNQAQIFIESVRDLKKGGVKETLDIQISDASGIRPYEMFSGGEAFRIDFALRIAISKLLARRAGTALQTLIIDEGFGSQDEDGLHHIMDALYAIQSDFAKIVIVSHLPLMKDNFPVHFVIEKGPLGSAVRIEERG